MNICGENAGSLLSTKPCSISHNLLKTEVMQIIVTQ